MRRKEPKEAGDDLKAAALNLERAAKRMGLELDAEGQPAVEDERRVADKLIEGVETATTEVERAVKRLAEEMQEGGKGIEAGPQQSVLNVAAFRWDSGKFTPEVFRNFLLRIARVVWTFLLTR
jgi:hypothetical protein